MRFRPPIPQVPRPGTTRGRWLARQRIDDAAGRFNERMMCFDFPRLTPGSAVTLVETVTSLGGRFVRCLAMRGSVASSTAPSGTEFMDLRLRLQINGDNDFVGQPNGVNFVSFQTLFASPQRALVPPVQLANAAWLTWLSPPYFRAGDLLTATLVNDSSGEGAPDLTGNLCLQLIDDDLWQELWNRDVRAGRGDA